MGWVGREMLVGRLWVRRMKRLASTVKRLEMRCMILLEWKVSMAEWLLLKWEEESRYMSATFIPLFFSSFHPSFLSLSQKIPRSHPISLLRFPSSNPPIANSTDRRATQLQCPLVHPALLKQHTHIFSPWIDRLSWSDGCRVCYSYRGHGTFILLRGSTAMYVILIVSTFFLSCGGGTVARRLRVWWEYCRRWRGDKGDCRTNFARVLEGERVKRIAMGRGISQVNYYLGWVCGL